MQNTTFFGRLEAKKATRASQRRFEGDNDRNTCALADGVDMHVTEIDVPRLVVRVVGAAAGQGGHAPQLSQFRCPESRRWILVRRR